MMHRSRITPAPRCCGPRSHTPRHLQVFGFLVRKAPSKRLRPLVVAIVAEGVATGDPARTHGAATVLAESLLAPRHGLHSRSEEVLSALLELNAADPASPPRLPGTPPPTALTKGGFFVFF